MNVASSLICCLLTCGLFPISSAWIATSTPLTAGRFFRRTQRHPLQLRDSLGEVESTIGLNELHTLLRDSAQKEDYMEAGRVSDILRLRLYGPTSDAEEKKSQRRRMGWKGLGAAPWLTDRLDSLNYTFPTTIQINAMEAVNAILNTTAELTESVSLEERVDVHRNDMGIVISGTTGSGKTLGFSVPLLSTLSDSLFTRQRTRVGAEEAVGDATGDLLDRIAVVTSPVVRSKSRKQTREGRTIATGASLMSSLGESGTDVKSPLALVVVPTRELGVQTAMIMYQLVGGNLKDDPTAMPGRANMFKYKGPKGVRIATVLDDEEASYGMKLQTDVAITTPEYLGKLIDDGDVVPSKLRVIVYDEADLALEQTSAEDLERLFDDDENEREYTRLTYLVGASVTKALGNLAVGSRILPEGKSYIAAATSYGPLLQTSNSANEVESNNRLIDGEKSASLKELDVCLYQGLKHERVVVQNDSGLLTLTRLLRRELQAYDTAVQEKKKATDDSNGGGGGAMIRKVQRPRVVVFFPDEVQAKAAIEPLRDAMWGEHKLCVLLPNIGEAPLAIMDQFKRDETSVMLATANSVRGLDFPALTHVYTLYLPMEDPREYIHLAGRVGRVGQNGIVMGDGGHVVSILKDEEAGKMDKLAKTLGFQFTDIEIQPDLVVPRDEEGSLDVDNVDVEKMRRLLEDTITLVDLAEGSNPNDIVDAEVIAPTATESEGVDEEHDAFQ